MIFRLLVRYRKLISPVFLLVFLLSGSFYSSFLVKIAFAANLASMSISGGSGISLNDTSVGGFSSSFTLSAWVQPSGSGYRQILEKASGTGVESRSYGMYVTTGDTDPFGASNALGCEVNTNIGRYFVENQSTDLPNGETHLVTCVYDGSNLKIYRDGIEERQVAASGTIINQTSPLTFGYFVSPDISPYSGKLDQVLLYSSALSASDISSLYHFGIGTNEPQTSNLMLRFDFDNSVQDYFNNGVSSVGTIAYSGPLFVGTATSISTSSTSSNVMIGTPFTVDVKADGAGLVFNAARATVAVSSNLSITGIHAPTSNACNFQYAQTPTVSDPSFAGAIYGGSSTGCTVYRLTLTPTASGTGTITFTNGSIKSYATNGEILEGVQNGSFTISAAGSTPTPTTGLSQLTLTSPLETYTASFTLFGTKDSAITSVFVNGSATNSAYPTSTTWQAGVNLTLGANTFTFYGKDAALNQTATQTTSVNLHTLGDINGDGVVDLTDASLFAVDWDKTSNLTYILSDMNGDGSADLTDLSILAKLETE